MLTEGRVTEPEYVRQLAGRLGIAGGAIVLEDVPAVDPATLLKRAKELRADNKRAAKRGQEPLVDQWWILSDTEGPRHPHPKIKETAVAARQAGISIAFSDPCFEYWLLLHYVYTTGGELEAKDMVKRLGEFIPGYGVKSKHPELGDATENLVRARERRKGPRAQREDRIRLPSDRCGPLRPVRRRDMREDAAHSRLRARCGQTVAVRVLGAARRRSPGREKRWRMCRQGAIISLIAAKGSSRRLGGPDASGPSYCRCAVVTPGGGTRSSLGMRPRGRCLSRRPAT